MGLSSWILLITACWEMEGEPEGTRKKQSNVEMRARVLENEGDSDHNWNKVKITEKDQ